MIYKVEGHIDLVGPLAGKVYFNTIFDLDEPSVRDYLADQLEGPGGLENYINDTYGPFEVTVDSYTKDGDEDLCPQ